VTGASDGETLCALAAIGRWFMGEGVGVGVARRSLEWVSFSDQPARGPCALNGFAHTTCRAAAPRAASSNHSRREQQNEAPGEWSTARNNWDDEKGPRVFSSGPPPPRTARVMRPANSSSRGLFTCYCFGKYDRPLATTTASHPCSIIHHNPRPWAPPLRRFDARPSRITSRHHTLRQGTPFHR
jgi:hypothetical protein